MKPVKLCKGVSVSIHETAQPSEFGQRNRGVSKTWRDANRRFAKDSVWLAPNGVLLITHGDPGFPLVIITREECDVTPPVEAAYYAWVNEGVYSGPHADKLLGALEAYNKACNGKAQ